MSKFWKLLIVVVLFSVGSQLLAQEETTKQEVKKEVYRIDIPKQRPWVSDMRHKKIRMKYKMNHHMKDERKKKFKRKVKQRRLITFLTGMVVGYHIGVK